MRMIDRMMRDAQTIHKAMQSDLFFALIDEHDPVETMLHLKTASGVEVIKETHESIEAAERYIEEMEKRYNVNGDLVTIIDNIPYAEEECNEREENAIETDLCHGS